MIDLDAITPETPVFVCGKVEGVLPTLPAGAINLEWSDPPYHKVLGEEWDHRHRTAADFLAWLGSIADEWRRVLAPNGSSYTWASPKMAARVEVMLAERLEILNSITWAKAHAPLRRGDQRLSAWYAVDRSSFRKFNSESERLIFAEHRGADSMALGESGYAAKCEELRGFVFEPIRKYLDDERKAAGFSVADVAEAWRVRTGNAKKTGMAGHWFSPVQWALPTENNYLWLRAVLNGAGGDQLRRDYVELRREYGHLRREYGHLRREYEDLRRPFSVTVDVPHTDVWTYPTVEPGPGRHPAEKPIEMCRDVLRASTRPGDLVLDCFSGSAPMAAACVDLGRRVISIDDDPRWIRDGSARADRHLAAKTGQLHRPEMAKIRGPLFEPRK